MGAKFLRVNFEEKGDAEGGYAKEMSKEWFDAAFAMLEAEMPSLDAIITTALIPGKINVYFFPGYLPCSPAGQL